MRATWSTAGALAALVLPAAATAADGSTVPVTTTSSDAAVAPAPSSGEPAPATPPAPATTTEAPAATMPAPETVPPAPDPPSPGPGTTAEATPDGPGAAEPVRPDARRDPLPDVAPTGTAGSREKRDRVRKGDRRKRTGKAAGAERREATSGKSAPQVASSAADLLLGGRSRGLADLSVKDFRIPPFLLPIYQAAGVQYGIRWEILAAINEIETDYGRNLSVSSAGALGWMQFMPGTWKAYGVDATGDRQRDPYNPVDAIFAAARYLQASGAATDIRKAIFAYNHAGWYVDDVLRRAQAIARLPADVVASLSGLTLAQLPVYVEAPADDADDDEGDTGDADAADADAHAPEVGAGADGEADAGAEPNADATPLVEVASGGSTEWATVRAPADAPVVAVQDATVTRIGTSPRWGRFVELRDAYGNRYAYTHLGALATEHLTAKQDATPADDARPLTHAASTEPTSPPTATSPTVGPARPRSVAEPGGAITTSPTAAGQADQALAAPAPPTEPPVPPTGTTTAPAPPTEPPVPPTGTTTAPAPPTEPPVPPTGTTEGETATAPVPPTADTARATAPPTATTPGSGPPGVAGPGTARSAATTPADTALIARYVVRASGLRRTDMWVRPLRVGSKVMAGTILGRLDPSRTTVARPREAADQGAPEPGAGTRSPGAPEPGAKTRSPGAEARRSSFRFAIRPAGKESGRIDPRPILDGWRLLDDAAVFGNELPPALAADRDDQPDVGRVLLLSKAQLQQRVLANPRLEIYAAGREDIRAGAIDRRVLATMEYLTAHGLRLTITSLRSGHSYLSASGNVSAHSYGSAMDIAVVNGTVISSATQGPGSITDRTNRLLLRLQGTMRPNQIISLMTYPGTDNTLAMADHDDHIHVGFPRAAEPDDGPVRLASLKVGDTTLAPGLRHDQWQSLMDQLASIENPSVAPKVSSSALPAPKAKRRAAPAKARPRAER